MSATNSDSAKRPLDGGAGEEPPHKYIAGDGTSDENNDYEMSDNTDNSVMLFQQKQMDTLFKRIQTSFKEEIGSSVTPEIRLLNAKFDSQQKEIDDLKRNSRYTPLINSREDVDETLEIFNNRASQALASGSGGASGTGARNPVLGNRGRSENFSMMGRGSSNDRQRNFSAPNFRGIQSRPRGRGRGRGRGNGFQPNQGFGQGGQEGGQMDNGGSNGGTSGQSSWNGWSKDDPIGGMSHRDLESVVRRLNRETYVQSSKAQDFAAREIILIGFPETTNDLALAHKSLKVVDPTFKPWEILRVQRFHQADKSGHVPLKIILKRTSIAEQLGEAIELAGDKIPWARRGQTWAQRRNNGRELKNIEWENSQNPEDHPTRLEHYYFRGNVIRFEAPNPAASSNGQSQKSGDREPETGTPSSGAGGG